jgi:hypothetical protein
VTQGKEKGGGWEDNFKNIGELLGKEAYGATLKVMEKRGAGR